MKHAVRDRFKVTKTGKVMRRPMGIGHSRAKKTGKYKRGKRKQQELHSADERQIRQYL
jgi:ribosomal protein L35